MLRRLLLFVFVLRAFLAAAAPLRDDENVVLFPGLGWNEGGLWNLEVRGWVFENERRPGASQLLMKFLAIDPATLTAAEKETFDRRSKLFLIDAERDKKVEISLGGKTHVASSLSDGYFAGTMLFEDSLVQKLASADGRQVLLKVHRQKTNVVASGVVQLITQEGLSVVSDIDDTIKISNVRDRKKLLRNTFLAKFEAVPGMAELYRVWATNSASFHYVSASPYQLYLPLAEFVAEGGFPAGSFHLRSFNWQNGLAQVLDGPQAYKFSMIEPLLRRFPRRGFVLVGDSGEHDPEIYGELTRKFPQQIRRIYIRDVTDENAKAERYTRAFVDISPEKWRIFTDAKTLQDDQLVPR
jgi:phosphatidate phosphatase APP1